jgi:hypothetical protein
LLFGLEFRLGLQLGVEFQLGLQLGVELQLQLQQKLALFRRVAQFDDGSMRAGNGSSSMCTSNSVIGNHVQAAILVAACSYLTRG